MLASLSQAFSNQCVPDQCNTSSSQADVKMFWSSSKATGEEEWDMQDRIADTPLAARQSRDAWGVLAGG